MAKKLNIFEAPIKGVSLVEAGAGTGKTYNIASLYIRTILEKKLMPGNILVLTFTNAATAELKTRLRNRIKDSIEVLEKGSSNDEFLSGLSKQYDKSAIPLLKKALYEFDEAEISTIHGFCQQLIRENALTFNISPDFEVLTDDTALLQEVIDNYWRNFFKTNDSEYVQSLQYFVVESGLNPDKLRSYCEAKIKKNYSVLIPETKEISKLEDKFEKAKKAFNSIKEVFEKEKQSLISLFESGVMNGQQYKKSYFYRYIEEFSKWLSSDIVPLLPFHKIKLFSGDTEDWVKQNNTPPHFEFVSHVNAYLDSLEPFKHLSSSLIKNAISTIINEFDSEKTRLEVLNYDDLLSMVATQIQDKESDFIKILRSKYPVALIDEFQDTDPIQYSIFKPVYTDSESTALFMIGDPKQAIYSFRGADIHTYIEAKKDAHPEQVYLLEDNYRSNPVIIDAVNTLFSNQENIFLMDEVDFNPVSFPDSRDPEVSFLELDSKRITPLQLLKLSPDSNRAGDMRKAISDSVASEVVRLLSDNYQIEGKKVKPGDIAILVSKHLQASEMQASLTNVGVKSILRTRSSVFKTPESEELYLILSAVADVTFEDQIRAALSTQTIGFTASDISSLLEDETGWSKAYDQFLKLNKTWRTKSFSVMIEELIQAFNVEQKLSTFENSERRITNVQHIIELLKKADTEHQYTPSGLLRYLLNKQSDSSNGNDEELVRLESDDDLVQIVTVHSSKGLEYPVVFCPYLWKGIEIKDENPFSFYDSGETYLDLGTIDPQRKENRLKKVKEDLAEEIRLNYVALTRAKSACFVYVLEESGSELSSLAVLSEGVEIVEKRIEDKLFNDSNKYKRLHPKESFKVLEGIQSLEKESVIEVREAALETNNVSFLQNEKPLIPAAKTFNRKGLDKIRSITSFSALSGMLTDERSTLDDYAFDYDEINQSDTELLTNGINSRFSLPKGAKTGTLLHTVFEEVDFADLSTVPVVVESELHRLGFEDQWKQTVEALIEDSISHVLFSDFQLACLKKGNYLVEMEFHFPVDAISAHKLLSIIRGQEMTDYYESIDGYMKGFIDLIFKYEGKYFILDYKSNFLGDNQEDYSYTRLKEEIYHSNYDLQYHIYTVALHRFLTQQANDYNYETHFGGVIYLFLRGIERNQKGSGVFFEKPNFDVIKQVDRLMRSSNE